MPDILEDADAAAVPSWDAPLANAPDPGSRVPPGDDAAALRLTARILGATALAAVLLAVLVNWLWSPARPQPYAATGAGTASTAYAPRIDLEKPAVELLPSQIIAFETIARHAVPGQGKRSAEAIYVTLNMELDVQVPISVYARVDGFASSVEARAYADDLMRQYPVRRAPLALGTTQAMTGYRADEGAWVVTWTRGQYSVFVKSAFKDKVPAEKRDFLRNLGRPVATGIETFQRTGKQGLTF